LLLRRVIVVLVEGFVKQDGEDEEDKVLKDKFDVILTVHRR